MSRILLVEDNPEVIKITSACLKPNEVVCAETLKKAEALLSEGRFDLILLDIGLPDGDGVRFYTKLQTMDAARDVPIFFLTGKKELSDKVIAFSLGAEDYITKPFDPLELQARVEARLKKIRSRKDHEDVITLGSLKINVSRQQLHVTSGGESKRIDLTPIEFKLLVLFARNEERVLTRDKLITDVWGGDIHVLDRTVDTHVSNLRRKLEGATHSLNSVYGSGYSLSAAKAGAKGTKKKKAA